MTVTDTQPPDRNQAMNAVSRGEISAPDYDELRNDPIAATNHVYEHFGWRLREDVEDKMRAVLTKQTSRTNGVHRYNAAYFQLEGMNGFTEYCERFGFAPPQAMEQEERAGATAVR